MAEFLSKTDSMYFKNGVPREKPLRKVGRPISTGYTNADNFRSKFLSKTGFRFKRVPGTGWFLLEQPQNLLNKDWRTIMEVYTTRLLEEFCPEDMNMKPYTHIVFVDRYIPQDREEIYNRIVVAYGRPSLNYNTTGKRVPAWYTSANGYLRLRDIEFTTVHKGYGKLKDVLSESGLPLTVENYEPNDFEGGWRIIRLLEPRPLRTAFQIKQSIETEYIVLRDYVAAQAKIINTTSGPSRRERVAERWFMWCANNMTDDNHLRPHNRYTTHEEVLAGLVKAMEYIAQENGVVLEIKHAEYNEMQGTDISYQEWCEQKVMSILHSLQEDPISWAEAEAGCDDREQTVAALL